MRRTSLSDPLDAGADLAAAQKMAGYDRREICILIYHSYLSGKQPMRFAPLVLNVSALNTACVSGLELQEE